MAETLKWAWVQYLSLFAPIFLLVRGLVPTLSSSLSLSSLGDNWVLALHAVLVSALHSFAPPDLLVSLSPFFSSILSSILSSVSLPPPPQTWWLSCFLFDTSIIDASTDVDRVVKTKIV